MLSEVFAAGDGPPDAPVHDPPPEPDRGAQLDAVEEVGHDDDWPKELYERLGFKAAGRVRMFHRLPMP